MKKVQYEAASRDENEGDHTPREFPEIDHIGLYTVGILCFLSMPLILSASRSMSYAFTAGSVSYRFVDITHHRRIACTPNCGICATVSIDQMFGARV